jgi:hypothetical protein
MAKGKKPKDKREAREQSLKDDEFLKPIDVTQFGTDNDPCFGKLYNLAEDECRRCGDQALCGLVFGQNLHVKRKGIEDKNRFKDLEMSKEEPKNNKALTKWVKSKKEEGLSRTEVIKKAKYTYGSTREEIKEIWKKL